MMFLNAMTDLGHKIAIQNTVFKIYDGSEQIVLTAIINASVLLPYIIFFLPSGQTSDRYPKELVMRYSALIAVGITLLIGVSYYFGEFWIAFGLTLLLATQSAFYSPAKYGYIRELLGDEKTEIGNSWVQATTIVAILFGTLFYSILFENLLQDYTSKEDILQFLLPIALLLFSASLLEFLLSFRLPNRKKMGVPKKFHLPQKSILKAVLFLALFFSIAQVILVVFGAFIKTNLGETNTVVVQGLMALSGVGIVIGSFVAGVKKVGLGTLPLSFLSVFILISLIPIVDSHLLFASIFLVFGFFGGLIIVPLNSYIQLKSSQEELGMVLANNNLIQNIFMVSFLALVTLFALFQIDEIYIFYILSGVAIVSALLSFIFYFRPFVRTIFNIRYSIHQIDEENRREKRTLYVSNHISWIDWLILGTTVDGIFIMERSIYNKFSLFFKLFKVIPISRENFRESLDRAGEYLKNGENIIIFAEGEISRYGHLGEIRRGYQKILESGGDEVQIVPIFIEGVWGSVFSRSKTRFGRGGFRRKIFVAFGKPIESIGKIEPLQIEQALRETSVLAWREYISSMDTLPNEWIRSVKRNLFKKVIFDGNSNTTLTNLKFATAVLLFSKLIKERSSEERVGTILPSSSAGAITNMAILYLGKKVVNLNFTSGEETILYAMEKSKVETVFTSRKFINILEKKGIHLQKVLDSCRVFYLEDLKEEIGTGEKLGTLLKLLLLPKGYFLKKGDLEDEATVIFSSGSESLPKGVVLTHRNVLTNIVQAEHFLNIEREDRIFGILPLFHSFGFTITTMLPLLKSIPLVSFGNPTETDGIKKVIKNYNPNIIFGTSTIYRLYVKKLDRESFKNFRFIIAGAEKLSEKVWLDFEEKFGKVIYEGYGTTETAPASGVNLPSMVKHGTVGKPLSGTLYKILDPESREELPNGEAGMITIVGNQVMRGYLRDSEKTEKVLFWRDEMPHYMTGDKGYLDRDGFLKIVDRYSRFVKIGGEMVSLGAISEDISRIGLDIESVAVGVPDSKKGEKIVLLVKGEVENLKTILRERLQPNMVPTETIFVDEMPLLGSGKVDFSKAKRIAMGE
jgi:acyl-[acyl-carrier-protein]-phospholipid O-acyltransferase/long-chain-fatty-acid--[acyl-carrier-protein] ligase